MSKYKHFICEIYEESTPKNYLELLKDMVKDCNIVLSPWHDKDKKDDGTYKKKHRHILVSYPTNVSFQRFKEDMVCVSAVIPPTVVKARCSNPKNMMVYFIHQTVDAIRDKKTPYNPDDMYFIGDFTYEDFMVFYEQYKKVKHIDKNQTIVEIYQFIKENDIYIFADLYDYCIDHNLEWLITLNKSGNYNLIVNLMKSLQYRNKVIMKLDKNLDDDITINV